ncbi:MAG: ATP synthase subunit I [Pyrinomonadaceae bacterium]
MSDESEPIAQSEATIRPISHGRILKLMAVIGAAGILAGAALVSVSFGAGVAIGCVIAFLNYYWLKGSLRRIFEQAAASRERPRFLALQYITRYVVLGIVVAIFYVTGAVSVVGLILGMGSFGFAVVFEGLLNIFNGPASSGQIDR